MKDQENLDLLKGMLGRKIVHNSLQSFCIYNIHKYYYYYFKNLRTKKG